MEKWKLHSALVVYREQFSMATSNSVEGFNQNNQFLGFQSKQRSPSIRQNAVCSEEIFYNLNRCPWMLSACPRLFSCLHLIEYSLTHWYFFKYLILCIFSLLSFYMHLIQRISFCVSLSMHLIPSTSSFAFYSYSMFKNPSQRDTNNFTC